MRRIRHAVVCAALAALSCGPGFAEEPMAPDDPAVVGSEWVGGGLGVSKRPGEKPVIASKDVSLVITERDGETFAGIFAHSNGAKRAEVRGTIKRNGAVQFIVTKVLTGEARDVVGLVKLKGKLKEGRMTLTFESSVGTKRAGAIGLERKDPNAG